MRTVIPSDLARLPEGDIRVIGESLKQEGRSAVFLRDGHLWIIGMFEHMARLGPNQEAWLSADGRTLRVGPVEEVDPDAGGFWFAPDIRGMRVLAEPDAMVSHFPGGTLVFTRDELRATRVLGAQETQEFCRFSIAQEVALSDQAVRMLYGILRLAREVGQHPPPKDAQLFGMFTGMVAPLHADKAMRDRPEVNLDFSWISAELTRLREAIQEFEVLAGQIKRQRRLRLGAIGRDPDFRHQALAIRMALLAVDDLMGRSPASGREGSPETSS